MKSEHTRKLIGGLATLLGVWWTWIAVVPPISKSWSGEFEAGDIVFLLTIVPLMAIPGILAVVFGLRFFREMRESSLKWVIGVIAVFFAFFLSSQASIVLPSFLPEDLQGSVFLLVASLIAIVAYLLTVRFLLRHFTQEDRSLRSLLGRDILVLMALQIWILLSEFFREYSPTKEGYPYVSEEPWGILGVVVPIALAYGSYRIVATKLTRAQQGAAEQSATARESI